MSFYREERKMEYGQGYGSSSPGKFGGYNDQSYGGGFSTAGAYGCDSGGQAQLHKMQTQNTPPRTNVFSDHGSEAYHSSSQAHYSSGGGGGAGYAAGHGGSYGAGGHGGGHAVSQANGFAASHGGGHAGGFAAGHGGGHAGGFAAGHGGGHAGAGFGGGHGGPGGVGDPFCALVPSSFPPGTDPKMIECFNRIDRDGSGFICDVELQTALSSFDQRFCMRTVHLLMYMFTGSNAKMVGPKEFVPLLRSLQSWKAVYQRFDRDRNGKMDGMELKEALRGLGFTIPPFAVQLLVSKFSKAGSKCFVEYDYFIECCLVVKGLTEKFKCKEDSYSGTATFTYDEFLLSVLPFIVA